MDCVRVTIYIATRYENSICVKMFITKYRFGCCCDD